MNISVCGLVCNECQFFQKNCNGCQKVKGETFWAQEMPGKTCPIFACSINTKHYQNCGSCTDLPCQTFRDLKDPNIPEEEHKKMLIKRVERLKK
ncbi:MAG: DUF3795 domain-containing protein [Candidatus Riflebacteria bacterium]|nr:DUF3795 domain-containing protein [Candidatus Riflebacteria bacterium]